MSECIFCRIVRGEIPSRKLYEDDRFLAFHDINPVAKIHFLIVPKAHIESLQTATQEHNTLLGDMLLLANRLANEQGLTDGFRTIINTGRGGGQTVFHLHIHIMGGGKLPMETH